MNLKFEINFGRRVEHDPSEQAIVQIESWLAPAILPGLEFLLQSRKTALKAIRGLVYREDSEFWWGNSILAFKEDQIIGGAILIPGDRILAARLKNLAVLARFFSQNDQASLIERINNFGKRLSPPEETELYVSGFGVVPGFQSRRYGSVMMNRVIQIAKDREFTGAFLNIRRDNVAMKRLISTCEFQKVHLPNFPDEIGSYDSYRFSLGNA